MKVRAMVYLDGLIAGIIGAGTIAIWFLFLDAVIRLPFYTPTVLGTALYLRPEDLASTERVQVSLKLSLMYTWVHGLAFIVLGEIAAYLLLFAAKKPNLRFGIVLLFVILELGFVGTALVFAEPVLHELAWPTVLLGNLLAAAGMAIYLWLRHPNFIIRV
jgi:hypothetical protein